MIHHYSTGSPLIYYYADALGQAGAIDETYEPEWELFDLEIDPSEMVNRIDDPAYETVVSQLKNQLHQLQEAVGDQRYHLDVD